jgi:phosphotransferase system IIA component
VIHEVVGESGWQRPSHGVIKINWDAAIDGVGNKMGYGIIARYYTGRVVAALSGSCCHITNPSIAKSVATWKIVKMYLHLGFVKVVLEGDSLEVVNALNKDELC